MSINHRAIYVSGLLRELSCLKENIIIQEACKLCTRDLCWYKDELEEELMRIRTSETFEIIVN